MSVKRTLCGFAMLAMWGVAAPSAAQVQAKSAAVPTGGAQGFSVVLVQGDLQGGASSDTVPAAARKALTDLKEFLPYKSYRLLDTQWTRGMNRAVSRLRGPEDREYEIELDAQPQRDRAVRIAFRLREPEGISYATAARLQEQRTAVLELRARQAEMEQRLAASKKAVAESREALAEMEAVRAELEALRRRTADAASAASVAAVRLAPSRQRRSLIDTTFNMDVGETVVVGTSRLQGDKALIVLLTAVGRQP